MKNQINVLWLVVILLSTGLSYSYWKVVGLEQKNVQLQETIDEERAIRTSHFDQLESELGDLSTESDEMLSEIAGLMDRVGYLEYRQGLIVNWVQLNSR